MRKLSNLLMCCLVGITAVVLSGCASKGASYTVVEEGSGSIRSTFDKKMSTPEEQLKYAQLTWESGSLRKAERRMLYLVRRWPSSKEAPIAARAQADILFERGHIEKAFDAYQFLIDNYSGRMTGYDEVLEKQFIIAKKIMERRHMRWIFGGYASPEESIDYFETMIRNGPQSEHAAEAQFLIGQSYQSEKEYELAIVSYQILGYRYPDSVYTEESYWQQIQCLLLLHRKYPRNPELRDRLLTTTNVFNALFPDSKYIDPVRDARNQLYETSAQAVYDIGQFYAEIAKKPESAILYNEALKKEYRMSELVHEAEEQITAMESKLSASSTPEKENE
ncbi:MAG: tetratricopeptide repeat protein [Pontiellaceae bacterium]|nr:tetratricopeptide repeat protein [Pontiellaceae bacterium]